jgi:hypothetical protein
VETGLRYVNNDMCYPAVIVIGDIVKAFQSGNTIRNDDRSADPDVRPVQGLQLPAACKRALASAGFGTVPSCPFHGRPLLEADLGISRTAWSNGWPWAVFSALWDG